MTSRSVTARASIASVISGFRQPRRAALMDLARLRGMITDKSATFHFHEDLARMTPDEQKRRVAELLEFAASIKVPGDSAIDVTPDEDTDDE